MNPEVWKVIGHEPIPPYATKTLLGRRTLALPNVFQYIAYIRRVDGFVGCYRGLGPKLCANTISSITYQKLYERTVEEVTVGEEDDEAAEDKRERIFITDVSRDVVCRTVAIVASQPFTVIAVRMMAQFVGGETKYCGIFSSIREIFQENGILGFFSGIVPRILGEIVSTVIASSLTFIVNSYLMNDRDLKKFTAASMAFIAGTITYPFQVVSNCMVVNNSGLIAGMPPHMPVYTSWIHCWSHLSRTNQLKRGSSLLIRYYTGPHIVTQGSFVKVNKNHNS
ncbi:hypothetical protein Cfor_02528 [Coptotermes formosanus]|uniref:Mitochondrial carrier-like protein n=1 Tax=Coptotermes formosanus TaxID=36987 RepID=A0A6L2PPE4_COPFO|nr:hypothetical protein Cfor_02528 [Coptotermes formosanus]